MKCTLLIGNGFDINLGLNTRYSDFYNYIFDTKLNQESDLEDNLIIKKLIDEKENGTLYENWADLELALGKFTEEIDENNLEAFNRDKMALDLLLRNFLKDEQEKLIIKKEFSIDINKITYSSINNLFIGNSENEDARINSAIYYLEDNNNNNLNIINFNYTNSFSKLFTNIVQTLYIRKRLFRKRDLLNIHGKVDFNNIVLGVNDESQVANQNILSNEYTKPIIIKPSANSTIGNGNTDKAERTIFSSNVICIYGVSLGDTDKMWWEKIGNWLKESTSFLLIIHYYDESYSDDLHYMAKDIMRNEIKEKFLEKANLSDLYDSLSEKIIVRINADVFNYPKEFLFENIDNNDIVEEEKELALV